MRQTVRYALLLGGLALVAGRARGEDLNPYQPLSPLIPLEPTFIHVHVPTATAQVWFEGAPTRQQGQERIFTSPPLPAGRTFTYVIRAAWQEGGREVVREKIVEFKPGRRVDVRFSWNEQGVLPPDGPSRPTGAPVPQPRGGTPR